MNIARILTFTFMLLISFQVNSQGVNGRRIIIGGRFDYFAALAASDHVFLGGLQGNLGVVVSRSFQINVGYNSYKFDYRGVVLDSINYENIGDATDRIRCIEYEASVKWYLRRMGKRNYDCIAPDGKYVEIGFAHTKMKHEPGELSLFVYEGEPFSPTAVSSRVFLGIGNQQVWWGRLVANTGVLVSVPVSTSYEEGYDSPYYLNWIRSRNTFRCYVGLGFIF